MAYIDATFIDQRMSDDVRQALFDDGSGYQSSYLTALIEDADAVVDAALANAGYSTGLVTPPQLVKLASFGQFLAQAYGRKGLKVPDQFLTFVNLAEGIRSGAVPVPSMTPTARDAVGGVSFSESSSTITSARPQVFSRAKLDVY